MIDEIAPRLDSIEKNVERGHGKFDLGLVGNLDHVGIGASLEHRLASRDISIFAEGQYRYDRLLRRSSAQFSGGFRWRW